MLVLQFSFRPFNECIGISTTRTRDIESSPAATCMWGKPEPHLLLLRACQRRIRVSPRASWCSSWPFQAPWCSFSQAWRCLKGRKDTQPKGIHGQRGKSRTRISYPGLVFILYVWRVWVPTQLLSLAGEMKWVRSFHLERMRCLAYITNGSFHGGSKHKKDKHMRCICMC